VALSGGSGHFDVVRLHGNLPRVVFLLANCEGPESGGRLGRLIGQSQGGLPVPGGQDVVVIDHLDLVSMRVLEIRNFEDGIPVFGQVLSASHGTHVGYSPAVVGEQTHHLVDLFVLEGLGELILNALAR
jgi:hypothetical protein